MERRMHLEDGLDIGAPFHYRSYPLYRRSCALLSARPPARIRGAHVLEGIIARAGDCPSKFGTPRYTYTRSRRKIAPDLERIFSIL